MPWYSLLSARGSLIRIILDRLTIFLLSREESKDWDLHPFMVTLFISRVVVPRGSCLKKIHMTDFDTLSVFHCKTTSQRVIIGTAYCNYYQFII